MNREPPNCRPPQKILDTVVAQRRGITSYHLVVLVEHESSVDGERTTLRNRYELWSDGERLRLDRSVLEDPRSGGRFTGYRFIQCHHCERSGYVATTSISRNAISPVVFEPSKKFDAANRLRIDWLYLDLGNSGYSQDASYAEFWASFAKPEVPHSANRVGDQRLVYEMPLSSKTKKRLELRADHGNLPELLSMVTLDPSGKVIAEQSTRVEAWPETIAGIWFPKSIRHLRQDHGNTLVRIDTQYEKVELNVAIDPQVFTLASFGLHDNTPVSFPESKEANVAPTWQHGKVDYQRTVEKVSDEAYARLMNHSPSVPTPQSPPSWWSRNWNLVIAIALAIIGVAILVRWRKRQAVA